MAARFAARKTPLEPFDAIDPNRKLVLEESPWLHEAKGGKDPRRDDELHRHARPEGGRGQERVSALVKLRKAQRRRGASPGSPGGPPSPYMTLYLVQGFARAAEFKVDVPKDMVQRAWRYLGDEFRGDWATCMANDGCWECDHHAQLRRPPAFPTRRGWAGRSRRRSARRCSTSASATGSSTRRCLKGYLALTLKRAGRGADAKLVFDSVMDSSKTTPDEGTFWQPEDRAWLWYNDTIESHALRPASADRARPEGLAARGHGAVAAA